MADSYHRYHTRNCTPSKEAYASLSEKDQKIISQRIKQKHPYLIRTSKSWIIQPSSELVTIAQDEAKGKNVRIYSDGTARGNTPNKINRKDNNVTLIERSLTPRKTNIRKPIILSSNIIECAKKLKITKAIELLDQNPINLSPKQVHISRFKPPFSSSFSSTKWKNYVKEKLNDKTHTMLFSEWEMDSKLKQWRKIVDKSEIVRSLMYMLRDYLYISVNERNMLTNEIAKLEAVLRKTEDDTTKLIAELNTIKDQTTSVQQSKEKIDKEIEELLAKKKQLKQQLFQMQLKKDVN